MTSPASTDAPTVAIDALSAVSGGGLSVARGLSKGLGEVRPEWKFILFASHEDAVPREPPRNLEIARHADGLNPIRRLIYEQMVLPRRLSGMRVDVLLLLGGFKVFRSQMDQIAVWQNAHIWSPPVATHSASLKTYIAMQRLVMRATLPRVRKNIFLSSDSVRRFSEYFGVAAHNATVAPIGLDDVFLSQPPPPSLAERDPILLAVGEVYAHKRFEITIDALAHLTSRGFSLELWIAGKVIDQRSFKRLTEQIESTGLSGRVRFLGHVNRIHLIELYRSASIFITSTRLETFGLTPLEAMSCGLPVIACAESAVPEVCDSAAVYADASGRSIAESAEALLRNRAEWSNLQARGLRRSRAFSWSAVAERYAEIIEQVIAG